MILFMLVLAIISAITGMIMVVTAAGFWAYVGLALLFVGGFGGFFVALVSNVTNMEQEDVK